MDEEPQPGRELAAEALVAITGVFADEPVSPAQARLAPRLPREWRAAVLEFLTARRWKAFRMPRAGDPGEIHDRLAEGLDAEHRAMLVSALLDPDLGEAYLGVVARGRTWLQGQWPALSLDTPLGPRYLPPSKTETWRAASLLAVVDDPARVLEEMRMGTLGSDQARAFRECYPELFGMLRSILQEELARRFKDPDHYALPWARERVLRVLLDLPPDVALAKVADKPVHNPAPKASAEIKTELQTRAQALAAR